jgi:RecB family endonuclease NucS
VKKLVLTEVKRKDNRQEAQVQLERYLRLLTKKDEANLEKFWGLYKEYLKSKGKNKKK